MLFNNNLAQIGYSYTNEFSYNAGVGDDDLSFAYDGCRCKKWNGDNTSGYGLRWKEGDVVGCAVDLEGNTMTFTLNGQNMEVAFEGFVKKGTRMIDHFLAN